MSKTTLTFECGHVRCKDEHIGQYHIDGAMCLTPQDGWDCEQLAKTGHDQTPHK